YDDLNTLEIFGELQFAASKDFNFGVNASYFNYTADLWDEAWNLPDIKASFFADVNFTEKFYGGLTLFYVGERKDIASASSGLILPYEIVTLDSFVDINLSFGYHINNQ